MSGDGRSPAELAAIAIDTCRSAAALIAERVDDNGAIGTKSSATDIVTATDLAAEQLIRRRLATETPGARVLGEEGGSQSTGDGPFQDLEWVVDPLDGTVNFAYGVPLSAVSIAAVRGGRTVAGAVIDIASGEEFRAHHDGGAWLGDEPIRVGDCRRTELALIATGYSYDVELRRQHGRTVAGIVGHVRDVRAFGSAALHLCWVAAGRIDGYLERDIKPWDHAAGAIIATEAGAVVELPCPENGSLVLAANGHLHAELRALVAGA